MTRVQFPVAEVVVFCLKGFRPKLEMKPGQEKLDGCFRARKVLGGFEPPSLDSESRVLTVTPLDLLQDRVITTSFTPLSLPTI